MNKRKINGRFWTAIGLSVAMLCGAIFAGGGYVLTDKRAEDGALSMDNTATVNAAVSYDTLPDGSAYYYSDVTKIVGFRNGTEASDVSSQPVNSSAAHGSADNPYVINTAAQWNAFAGDTSNATNANKVFVLGSDIDFAGKTGSEAFKPVPSLGAKFYGCNRKLINVTYNFGNVTTGVGVFNATTATAVITDFSLENVTFTGISAYGGFICGKSKASVLNCHVHGKLTGVGASDCGIGGIIGNIEGNTSRVYVYRCSVFADFNISTGAHGGVGGICGDADYGAGLSVYDCITICNYTFHTGGDAWFGGIFDITNISGSNTVHEIESCVVYSNIKDTANRRRAEGSLFNGWGAGTVRVNVKNTYSAGYLTGTYGPYDLYGGIYHIPNASNCTYTANNVNWYAQNPYLYSPTSGAGAINKIATGQWNGSGSNTRANMWLAAASSTSPLPNNIWVNKSVINDAYMTNTDITSSTGYTIENSPVRNPLIITVSYYNYTTNNGDVQYPINGDTEPQIVNFGDTLYEPTAPDANHKFEGWTLNKNDGSKPIKTVPTTMLGDNKLYAVWSVPSTSVRLNVTVGGSNYIENATTGATITYNEGTVRLNSSLSVDGMSNPTVTYSWKKDGAAVASGGNTANYNNIRNVKDSGDYTLAVNFVSPNEPLWFGSAESAAQKVTVKPAKLTVFDFAFEEGDHAYSGSPYTNAHPVAVMHASNGDVVTGTTRWAIDLGKFNNPDNENVSGGREKKDIIFTPDASYEGNYGTGDTYEVDFEIEFLQMTFHIPSYANLKLTTNLEYGQRYSFNNVADMFEDLFKGYMGDPNLSGYTPVFQWNGDKVKINDFRKLTSTGSTGTNNAYYNVNESKTIVVEFAPQTYTVTFEPRNGVADEIRKEGDLNYGVRLTKPADPVYGMQLFLGWYYDVEVEKDGASTTETRKWSFDSDRVTGDMTLYGKWLDADTFTELKVTVNTGASFVARQELKPENITVTACFEGQAEDGTTITSEAVLDATQYVITYSSADALLHVTKGGTTPVTISYTFVKQGEAPVTKEFTLNLTVTPILIDTSKLSFKDKREVYDGTAKKLEITGNMSSVSNQLSPSKVTYTYIDESGNVIDAADVKEIGEYLVRAEFNVLDDFNAPAITARLSIVAANLQVTLKWDATTFVYNGQVQHPTPTFTDEDGETVELEYHVTGDDGVINVGSGYSITVELDTEGYAISGFNSTLFSITKATLKAPVYKSGSIEYTGTAISLVDVSDPEKFLEGFNPYVMDVVDGGSGTAAGRYTAVIQLKNTDNCSWESSSSNRVTVQWEIGKAHLSAIWDGYEHIADGNQYYPTVNRLFGIASVDEPAVNLATDVSYVGDVNVSEVGSYTIRVSINNTAAWASNYVLDDGEEWSFVIVPKSGMQIISIEWSTTELTFNGEVQKPTFTVMLEENGKDPVDITASATGALIVSDVTSKWAGDYTVTVNAKDGSNYFIRKGGTCSYRIVTNDQGEGKDPAGGTPIDPDGNGGNTDANKPNNGITLPSNLPLWQLIVGGVSAILSVVFLAKIFGYTGRAKRANKKVKEAYSFGGLAAVLLAMDGTFLGMGEMIWTIVACALAGLMVLLFIVMLVCRKRCLVSEEAAENTEKDARRRRDEEFKLMMASMMNPNGQAAGGYVGGDIKEIVGDVVASLMPAMQQTMQALPAPDNSELRAVIEQQQQMIEQMMNNQQQLQALPPPDSGAEERIRELEERMLEQQRLADERLAEQQRIANERMEQMFVNLSNQQPQQAAPANDGIRELQEQLAEQQRIADERLAEQQRLADERMAQMMEQMAAIAQSAPASQTVVQTDDGLRDILEKHGEILNDLMSKENVNNTVVINKEGREIDDESKVRLTLKEAYEKLTDPLKKVFDATGEYVMKNQEVVASEGKFAITYKYRGKQYLKLSIKRGYPTISYSTEGEQLRNLKKKAAEEEGVKVRFKMSELQIFDDSTLEVAKGVIDLRREQIDRDIELMKKKK